MCNKLCLLMIFFLSHIILFISVSYTSLIYTFPSSLLPSSSSSPPLLLSSSLLLLLLLLLFPLSQIPEYCQRLDEQDVLDNAFDLIFAFDEIVALGYRENVNLAQIRTFTEMDSHEEKVYEAMRKVGRERGRAMKF